MLTTPRPAAPSMPSLRQRIAPNGADLRLVEIIDPHTGVPLLVWVDVTSDPVAGDHIVVTDGIYAVESILQAGMPVPEELEVLGVSAALIIPRR